MKHHNSGQLSLFKMFPGTATVTPETPCSRNSTEQSNGSLDLPTSPTIT